MSSQPKLSVVTPEETQDPIECTDRLLLDAWNSHQDPDAFTVLVQRYGTLVKGVCGRQSRSREDAEDAFQATFIALSRNAKRLRNADCLASWLHQVAYRTASRTRSNLPATEFLRDEPSDQRDSLAIIAHRHRLRALDEEIQRLPESDRCAIVLHYYEGCTYAETAERLHTTETVIRGRLQRARKKLHRRLLNRGVTLSLTMPLWSTIDRVQPVSNEAVQRTAESVMKHQLGDQVDPRLKPLLTSETSLMFSPTVISLCCAGTLAFTGLVVSQVELGSAGQEGKNELVVQGPSEAKSVETITTNVQSTTPAPVASQQPRPHDPFAENNASSSNDPFSDVDSFGGDDVDPFGGDDSIDESDPFGNTKVAKKPGNGNSRVRNTSASLAKTAAKAIPEMVFGEAVHQKIEQSLLQNSRFEFYDTPLADAMNQISEAHDVPILIDQRALEEIGLDQDVGINLELKDASLHSALRIMLRDLDLTYTIDDEHLQITTAEADQGAHGLLKVYWVTQTGLQASPESVEVIQTMIDPDVWSVMGGSSDITILGGPDESASGFAVRATYQTHRKIESFLKGIEKGTDQTLSGKLGNPPSESAPGSQGGMF